MSTKTIALWSKNYGTLKAELKAEPNDLWEQNINRRDSSSQQAGSHVN